MRTARCRFASLALLFSTKWILIVPRFLVSADLSIPKCPPAPADCIEIEVELTPEFNEFNPYYYVNKYVVNVELTESEYVQYKCNFRYLPIDDISLPKFEKPTAFTNVSLSDCAPPSSSYASALDKLNIIGFRHLAFWFKICDEVMAFIPQHFNGLELQTLTVNCDAFEMISYMNLSFLDSLPNLDYLELNSMVIPSLPTWNQLRSVELYDIEPAETLQSWGECSELEHLVITDYKVSTLPEGWLYNCSRLITLHLEGFWELYQFPLRLIASDSLRTLKITKCKLSTLPADLFTNIKNLRVLDLSHNNLQSIASYHFSLINLLEELSLLNNFFKASFLVKLQPLKRLRKLYLDSNISGDTCLTTSDQNNVTNLWPSLPSLMFLSLGYTGATRLCEEWKDYLPSLKFINLNGADITMLRYQDIQLMRASSWEIDLRRSKFETIEYNKSDYVYALKNINLTRHDVRIWIDSPRDCDCRWYWLSLVLHEVRDYIQMPNLTCFQRLEVLEDPLPFELMAPEEFRCKIDCEPGCKCYSRVVDNTTEVNCNGAGLAKTPRVFRMRKINLENNNINALNIRDFPETLEYMDLRNNQLSTVDPAIASMMFYRPTILYLLGGNRFQCYCNESTFVTAVQTHKSQVLDYDNVICAGNHPISNFSMNTQCLKEYAPVLGSVIGFVAFLFLITSILYYRYQNEIDITLYAWGWCSCCLHEKELDKNKQYDAFISFTHEDTPLVMDVLVPELEKEPHAFSVCVHHRDWTAGDWIPSQIAHSVEVSRRTIIVLSKNFLSSKWALLEFRAAHAQALKDRRVRLIIIVVGDVVNDQRMDDELRAYLMTNTYLKWGDPRFWDKLRYALPHRNRDELRLRAAGEEVVRRVRQDDPPMVLRDRLALEMLSIEPAPDREEQVESHEL